MAKLNRFVVDLVTEEELSQSRLNVLARELTDHLHVLGLEPEDEGHTEVNDKLAFAHVHDTADGDRCATCVELSLDYKNGDTVLAG